MFIEEEKINYDSPIYEDRNSRFFGITVAIVALVLFFLIILLYFVFRLIHRDTRSAAAESVYGTWEMEQGICDKDGKAIRYYTCTPNSITQNGCIGEDGEVTTESFTRVVSCNGIEISSAWQEEYGLCVDGVQTVTRRCVELNETGINSCTNVETIQDIDGRPVHVPLAYTVGDQIQFQRSCDPNQNKTGVWTLQGEGLGKSREQTFLAHYFLDKDCITDLEYPYNLLQEGIVVKPMVCDGSECPDLTICNTERLEKTSPPSLKSRGSFDTKFCKGVYSEISNEAPTFIRPCRYLPTNPVNFGSQAFNALVNHFSLFFVGDLPIAGFMTPNIVFSREYLRNYERSSEEHLRDVPLVALEYQQGITRPSCTKEQVFFNTGAFFVFGPRQRIATDKWNCVVGMMIPGHYRGWLKTRVIEGKHIAYWSNAADSVQSYLDGAGHVSEEAQIFTVTVRQFNSDPSPGYPLSYGRVGIQLRTTTNDRVYLIDSDQEVSYSLDNTTAMLFSFETEICSRSLYGPTSCNLYHSTLDGVKINTRCTPADLIT